jgi:phosphoribosylamine--glycine ligase
VLVPRIGGDFAELLRSAAQGAIDLSATTVLPQYCAGVVLATADYPRSSTPIDLSAGVAVPEGCQVFWGASKRSGGKVSSGGGRVLTVTALGDDLEQARARAYENVKALAKRLNAAGLTYRTDIGKL